MKTWLIGCFACVLLLTGCSNQQAEVDLDLSIFEGRGYSQLTGIKEDEILITKKFNDPENGVEASVSFNLNTNSSSERVILLSYKDETDNVSITFSDKDRKQPVCKFNEDFEDCQVLYAYIFEKNKLLSEEFIFASNFFGYEYDFESGNTI